MENNLETWMFWVTAIVFTAVGWYMNRDSEISFSQSKRITQDTIDTLIEMGFIKVVGHGKDQEMIKWPEEDILHLEEEEEDDTRSS
jgi:kynurenine formamidase